MTYQKQTIELCVLTWNTNSLVHFSPMILLF